jgi:hypothetical protein
MPTALERYRQLEKKLEHIRDVQGENSPYEDTVLEEMDGVWAELTDAEREALDEESACGPGANGPEKE